MIKFYKYSHLILIFAFGLFFIDFNYASAEINQRGLTLSPLRGEIEIQLGTSQDGLLNVTNSTDKPMKVNLSVEEFSVINQQYDYAFSAESDISKWVRFDSPELELNVGETKKVSYLIGVPISAEPGGRYISLFASTSTDPADAGIESRQRIASLLYITVLGDITKSGNLVSLTSPWLIGGESEWSAAIQNQGTTHFRSRYNVKINDIFFNNEVANMTGDAMILPGTVRLVTDKLINLKWPGIYKITYNIGMGDSPAKNETRILIFLPTYVLFIVLFAIIVTIIRSTIKKSNHHKQQKA